MTTTLSVLAVATPTHPGVPTAYRDLTGLPPDVLTVVGGYYQRGELIRYERPTEHADGTVTVRVHLRPGAPSRDLTVGTSLPRSPVPDAGYQRPARRWTAETVSAVAVLVFVAVMLATVYLASSALLEIATVLATGAGGIGAVAWLLSIGRNGGNRGTTHCPGCGPCTTGRASL